MWMGVSATIQPALADSHSHSALQPLKLKSASLELSTKDSVIARTHLPHDTAIWGNPVPTLPTVEPRSLRPALVVAMVL